MCTYTYVVFVHAEDSVFVEDNGQTKLTTFKRLGESIIEEHDAGVEDADKDSYEKEIKPVTKDVVVTVIDRNIAATTVKPVPLPHITK